MPLPYRITLKFINEYRFDTSIYLSHICRSFVNNVMCRRA